MGSADNTTVLGILNRQGSPRFLHLHKLFAKVQKLLSEIDSVVRARHIRGVHNVIADSLSRRDPIGSEWSLDSKTFAVIDELFGPLVVDLCATRLNSQLPAYISPCIDEEAVAIDVLSADPSNWSKM